MSDTKTITVEINEYALRNISNMQQRVYMIGEYFGTDSKEYSLAAESLSAVLAQVLRLGGRITAEDDLSLYGDSFIQYGVIFHRNRTPLMTKFGDELADFAGEWSVHS